MPVLSQIFIYPIKSLAGISVTDWPVDKNGLQYDRKWMLVDAEGQFLSQRRLPKMALIRTRIDAADLIVSATGHGDLNLPLHPMDGEDLAVRIWHDDCIARLVSDKANAWFSSVLDMDCRLVYHPDHRQRQVDQKYAAPNDQTAFSDGFPFLLIGENSLNSLNRQLSEAIGMPRFRPNLVVADCPAYAEDGWRRIEINQIEFRLPKPCSRCSVPTIDPDTALTGKEPLATLNRLRKWNNQVYFGQNALHGRQGSLSVGQRITILETGPNQPPLSDPSCD